MDKTPVNNTEVSEQILFLKQLDYGFNVNNRTIYLDNDLDIMTPCSINERIQAIIELSKDKKSPITLKISSYGGDVYGALGVIDVIQGAPVKINTLGIGAVMSAAVPIMVSATGKRSMTKNSTCMLHEISTWGGGKTSSIEIEVKELKRLESVIYKIMASKTKQNFQFWQKAAKHVDKFMDVKECLKYRLIDEIV